MTEVVELPTPLVIQS